MTQILNFLFLVASAVGATIVLSRGDIFKFFREWLNSLAIKKKLYAHTFDFSNPGFTTMIIDGVEVHLPASIDSYVWIKKCAELYLMDLVVIRWETKPGSFKCIIICQEEHSISFSYSDGSVGLFSKYPELTYRPFIRYIADLVSCPQCSGLWVGMIWYYAYLFGAMNYYGWRIFCTGCIVSAVAYLYFKVYTFLEKK